MTEKYEYAPAAGARLTSSTIHTGDDGLETQHVSIMAVDGPLNAYVARPAGRHARLPVVLVLSEAFGLHEHIADITRRFAHLGYFAIAPDLMSRHGNPMSFPDVPSLVQQLLLKIPDGQVMSDLDACVEWAISQGVDKEKIAVSGFCWGGRWTWLYAAHRQLACAVAWYGILDGRASSIFPDDRVLFPRHPIDVVNELKSPVLGLHGGKDEAIAMRTIAAMQSKLKEGSLMAAQSELVVYPNAPHAFFADYRSSYDASVAADAWGRCLDWLRVHLTEVGAS